MINLKNKKAQEMSITTIILLILGILVLVVVALGFWKGFDYVFGSIGLLPNDLNKAIAACKVYGGSPPLTASFCEKRELTINKVKGTYDCNDVYDAALTTLAPEKIEFSKDVSKCAKTAP